MNDTAVLRVGPQMRVTMHFAVRLMDGTELDSTFAKAPATFVWGDESLLPGFEKALNGLKAGDKRSVFIAAEQGFGEYNPDNLQHFRRRDFAADMVLTEGAVVSFKDASGAELPGVIVKNDDISDAENPSDNSGEDDDWVRVDFNHPLAGRELTFEVEILEVKLDAPEQPLSIR